MNISFYNEEKDNLLLKIETLKKYIKFHNEKINLLDKMIQLSIENIDIEESISVNTSIKNNNEINKEEMILNNDDNKILENIDLSIEKVDNNNDIIIINSENDNKNKTNNDEMNREDEKLLNDDNKVLEDINNSKIIVTLDDKLFNNMDKNTNKCKRNRDENNETIILQPKKLYKIQHKKDMNTIIFKIFRYIFRNKFELKKNQTNRSFTNFILSKSDEKYYDEMNKLIPYNKKCKCQWKNKYECCYAPYTAILRGGLSQYCVIHTNIWINQFMTTNNCETLVNEYTNIKFNEFNT